LPAGGIGEVLSRHGTLIAVPYLDFSGGDLRVWAMTDAGGNVTVLPKGALRKAAAPTADNPYPKCNVSCGGVCIPTEINAAQFELVARAMAYYSQNYNLRVAGFDIAGDGTKPLAPGMPSLVISEVNWSPDGLNYVDVAYPGLLVQNILTHAQKIK